MSWAPYSGRGMEEVLITGLFPTSHCVLFYIYHITFVHHLDVFLALRVVFIGHTNMHRAHSSSMLVAGISNRDASILPANFLA